MTENEVKRILGTSWFFWPESGWIERTVRLETGVEVGFRNGALLFARMPGVSPSPAFQGSPRRPDWWFLEDAVGVEY